MGKACKKSAWRFLVLSSLWMLQACAQAGGPSSSTGLEPPPGRREAPARPEPTAAAARKAPDRPQPSAPVPAPGSELRRELAAEKTDTYVHIVRWEGETLSHIAHWYTGSWTNWEAIARVNPGLDPARITLGDRVRIPLNLLKRREPLPLDAVRPSPRRSEPEPAGEKEPVAVTREIEMYGPAGSRGTQEAAPKGAELFEPVGAAGDEAGIEGEGMLFGPMESP